jgi:hypothetical protein
MITAPVNSSTPPVAASGTRTGAMRYLPAGRGTYGHPVLSIYQTDITYTAGRTRPQQTRARMRRNPTEVARAAWGYRWKADFMEVAVLAWPSCGRLRSCSLVFSHE